MEDYYSAIPEVFTGFPRTELVSIRLICSVLFQKQTTSREEKVSGEWGKNGRPQEVARSGLTSALIEYFVF